MFLGTLDMRLPGPLMRKYFSLGFVHLWKCALRTDSDIWDGDFITGNQGVERQWFVSAHKVGAADKPMRVKVTIKEQFEGDKKSIARLEFAFVQEDDAWKINDIIFLDNIDYNRKWHTPKEDESFREAFRRFACKR